MKKLFNSLMTFLITWLSRIVVIIILRLFYFFKIKNKNNVPDKGGFIIMSNHSSFWDPPIVGSGIWKRHLKFMARDTLFVSVWGQLLKWMGAFPVKRGIIDRNAYDTLINYIKSGEVVVFFPEGTRSPDGNIQNGKPGTGMLIYNSKAKVLPVYIHNSWKAWPKNKFPRLFIPITIVFGEMMSFDEFFKKEPSKELYIEITDKVIERIKQMQQNYLLEEAKKK